MKGKWILILWLVGILFPMAWLGKFSASYQKYFSAIFSPEWMHWVMHFFLYAMLPILVIWVFNLPISWKTLGMVIAATLVVGMLQEGLQLTSGVQILTWNTFLDLGVDTLGAIAGFGVFAGIEKRKGAGGQR